ncbi:MAG: uracil-DNA glycosylase family protein [Cellvibrionaceae bacterium]
MTDRRIASTTLDHLLTEVKACSICEVHLPHGPRPVVHMSSSAKVLIVGQAPGRRVHETGIPWNDPSGDRLRRWLNVSREQFYDESRIAIMPMGFCYPGTGKSGDLPPRKECAEQWHQRLLEQLPEIELTLLIGQYAQQYYLQHYPGNKKLSLTSRVQQWQDYLPQYLPLPHPSPRNQLWLKKNPWFDDAVVPHLQKITQGLIG